MKPETIKAIFTNLLFVIGVILLIIGFVQGTRTVVKLVVFNKYPLDTWEESKCDQPPYGGLTPVPVTDMKFPQQTNQEDLNKAQQKCEADREYERKVKVTEDIVGSITFLISGIALVYFFRRFILK